MKYLYPRVRDLREDKDLTQEYLAKKLDLHLTQYRRYETGESEIPTHIVKELAYFYNVSADYIIGIIDTPTQIVKQLRLIIGGHLSPVTTK